MPTRRLLAASLILSAHSLSTAQTAPNPPGDAYIMHVTTVMKDFHAKHWMLEACSEKWPETQLRNQIGYKEWYMAHADIEQNLKDQVDIIDHFWREHPDTNPGKSNAKLVLQKYLDKSHLSFSNWIQSIGDENFRKLCTAYPDKLRSPAMNPEISNESDLAIIRKGPSYNEDVTGSVIHANIVGNLTRRTPTVDIKTCHPTYPVEAQMLDQEGTVRVKYLISADGDVLDKKIARSSGNQLLDDATLDGFAKCKFYAALREGKPEQAWVVIDYVWKLVE